MEKVILIAFVVGCSFTFAKPSQQDAGECAVYGSSRIECGWLGIDRQTCLKRGCCFDSSDYRAKYCYVKRGGYLLEGQCPVAPSERQECGHFGITRQQCLNRQCCWDNSVPNTKWCFKQPKMKTVYCYIYRGVSGECRYTCPIDARKMYGMYVCGGRVCCYRSSYHGK